MPLIAHMLNDIQKLQIKLLSYSTVSTFYPIDADESASEERSRILIKELEEATAQKQQVSLVFLCHHR